MQPVSLVFHTVVTVIIQSSSEHHNKNFNSCVFDLYLELGTKLGWVQKMEIKGVA